MAIQTGSTYISDNMTDITEIPTANLGFSITPTAKKLKRAVATMTATVVVAIIWLIFCRARRHRMIRKSRMWRWNLDAICQSSRDVIISGFGGHIDIFGCRSLLYSLANAILHPYMVLYPSVVSILTVPFIA